MDRGGRNPSNYTSLASCFIHAKSYDKAEEAVTKALEIDPGFAPAIGTLGLIMKKIGNVQKARSLLKQAIKIDPSLNFAQEALESLGK
ncbi:MAG: tetratricopeptide repeat protein [Methanomassiliicoccales archaeon]|jgi:tetratricopeptide (TPR) repeat protein